MQNTNYNFEIRTLLTHFASAFDGVKIRRFDGNKYVKETIKVPLTYAPKSHILADIIGVTDTVKLPIMAVEIKSQGRDNTRIKNKIEDVNYKNEDGTYVTLKSIPWTITVELTVLAKYQEDMDQIIQNFSLETDPYVIISWQEPKTGREIRTEILWDGSVAYTYPGKQQSSKDPPFRVTGTTSFTIKGYLFKTTQENSKPICRIDTDIVFSDKFYCNYDELLFENIDSQTDMYSITGRPLLRYMSPYYTIEGRSPNVRLDGYGIGSVHSLYVSASNPAMYPMTLYQPFSGLNTFSAFPISSFNKTENTLTFSLPAPSADGFLDVIAVNSCGYGVLTQDSDRCNRVENPYPSHMPEHYSWTVSQFPFMNGMIVANYFDPWLINSVEEIYEYIEAAPLDRDVLITRIRQLMEYGGITCAEL